MLRQRYGESEVSLGKILSYKTTNKLKMLGSPFLEMVLRLSQESTNDVILDVQLMSVRGEESPQMPNMKFPKREGLNHMVSDGKS